MALNPCLADDLPLNVKRGQIHYLTEALSTAAREETAMIIGDPEAATGMVHCGVGESGGHALARELFSCYLEPYMGNCSAAPGAPRREPEDQSMYTGAEYRVGALASRFWWRAQVRASHFCPCLLSSAAVWRPT